MLASDVQLVSAEMIAIHQRLLRSATTAPALSNVGRWVGRIGSRLARPPRLAILGEFNSGKTTLANALLGARVLPTSLLNNTRVPVIAQFAEDVSLSAICFDGDRIPVSLEALKSFDFARTRSLAVNLPLERLKSIQVIDTPGLATGSAFLDARCRQAALGAHFAIWCTPATQAWKATEQKTWLSLPERFRKNAILAVTYKDVMADPDQLARLLARLQAEAMPYFSKIVTISARQAYRSRINPEASLDEAAWKDSGGASLQAAIDTAIAVETAHRVRVAQKLLQSSLEKAGISLPSVRDQRLQA